MNNTKISCYLLIFADKDWEDIKFGVDNEVDFYAVSFVKDAKVVHELKDYLKSKSKPFSLFIGLKFILYSKTTTEPRPAPPFFNCT